MAKNIPIWPGSASFSESLAAGKGTPFGLYDADTDFTSSADNLRRNWKENIYIPGEDP